MRTHVEFRSDKFPPYEGEEERINPGLWGKRVAEYLVEKLRAQGIETDEMNPEDWGWYVPIKDGTFPMALCCGHQYGNDDQFICFIDPWQPVIRIWFRKIHTTQAVNRVADALDTILRSDPDIRDIRWLENDEK